MDGKMLGCKNQKSGGAGKRRQRLWQQRLRKMWATCWPVQFPVRVRLHRCNSNHSRLNQFRLLSRHLQLLCDLQLLQHLQLLVMPVPLCQGTVCFHLPQPHRHLSHQGKQERWQQKKSQKMSLQKRQHHIPRQRQHLLWHHRLVQHQIAPSAGSQWFVVGSQSQCFLACIAFTRPALLSGEM